MRPGVARKPRRKTVLQEIRIERNRQDHQWGGPVNDDGHRAGDWLGFIDDHLGRAKQSIVNRVLITEDDYRQNLIEVAALAVAAVESLDRKRKAKR